MEKFKKLGISEKYIYPLIKKGFKKPTKIQELTIPILMRDNHDIIAQAQTGTGKTAAFGVPLIEKIGETGEVQALILAPTRELVLQVCEEINSFKGKKKISIIPIYGGQSIEIQLKKLKKGASIIVGTPGRILDHLKRRTLNLSNVKYFILDEADEMLNMGFIEDIEKIFNYTPDKKRVLLFSATMPVRIKNLAVNYMKNYKFVRAETEIVTDLTEHIYYEINESIKFDALCRILDINENFYGLVFCQTKIETDSIANKLIKRGYNAGALHGNLSQAQREKTLTRFRNRDINILVATDVAARGIDITELTHVINYSVPQNSEIYIHRIGRTGRAGKKGIGITFVTPQEAGKMEIIKRSLTCSIKKEKFSEDKDIFLLKKEKINGEIKKLINVSDKFFSEWAKELLSYDTPENVVKSLLIKFCKDKFTENIFSSKKRNKKIRLFVAKGKYDNFTKLDLVKFICKEADISPKTIEKVELYDNFSFITVPEIEAQIILHTFKKIKNNKKRPIIEKAKPKTY